MTRKIIAMSDYNYLKAQLEEIEAGAKELIPEVQESAMEILGRKIPEYVFSDANPVRAFTIWLGKEINPLLRKVADHANTGYSEICVINNKCAFFDVKEDNDKTSVLNVFLEVESKIPSSPTGRFYLQIIDYERTQSERAAFENLEDAIKAARAMIKILRKSTGKVEAIIESQYHVNGKPVGYWEREFILTNLDGKLEEKILTSGAEEAVKKLGELRDDELTVKQILEKVLDEKEIQPHIRGKYHLTIRDGEKSCETANFETLEDASTVAKAAFDELKKISGDATAEVYGHASNFKDNWSRDEEWIPFYEANSDRERFFFDPPGKIIITDPIEGAVPDDSTEEKPFDVLEETKAIKKIFNDVLAESKIPHGNGKYVVEVISAINSFQTPEDAIKFARLLNKEYQRVGKRISVLVEIIRAAGVADKILIIDAEGKEEIFHNDAIHAIANLGNPTEKKPEPKSAGEIFEDGLAECQIPHGSGNYRVGGYDFSRKKSLNADFKTLEDAIKFARLLNKAYMKAGKKIPVPVEEVKSAEETKKIFTINSYGVERIYHRDAIHAIARLEKRTPEEVKADITLFDDDYKVYKSTGPELTFKTDFGEIPLEKLDAIISVSTEVVANGRIHYRVEARFDSGEQKIIGSFKKKSEFVNFIQKLRAKLKLNNPLKWTLQNESFAWNKKEKKALFVASEDDSHDVYLDDKKLASFEKYVDACAFLVEKVRVFNAS